MTFNARSEPQELSFEQLRQETAKAVREAPCTQSDLADELDVHKSSVSRAVNRAGPHFWKLQRKIIEHLSPHRIERVIRFRMFDSSAE